VATVPALSLYDLVRQDLLADPYPFYHRLRDHDPVLWDPVLRSWVLTRHCDVTSAFVDPRLSEKRIFPFFDQLAPDVQDRLRPLAEVLGHMMLFLDPPDHTRQRRAIATALTPAAVAGLRPRIEQLVSNLLGAVKPSGRMDVKRDFSQPLSTSVIADLMAVPHDERGAFRDWTGLLNGFFGQSAREAERVVRLRAYFDRVVERHRHGCPGSGLLRHLLGTQPSDTQLSMDELFATYLLLFDAGQMTTTNLIANGVLALIRNPDQQEMLRADPSLMPSAIAELLRYDGPVQFTSRLARESMEIDGRQIGRGDSVTLVIAAANRDPARFAEPDRLDVTRLQNRHLAFGYGPHYCIGAPLALLEAEIAIGRLLAETRWLRLEREPRWQENINFRFLEELVVQFR
jgi:cytochrome P450